MLQIARSAKEELWKICGYLETENGMQRQNAKRLKRGRWKVQAHATGGKGTVTAR